MIPKVIHYCWFSKKPLPELAIKCIASWKKYCPDYEIIEWNESNFDLNCCNYVKEAYEAQKWAFVSDYARFWILYNYGGIYFDTDVELIRDISDIVEKGPFIGCEPVNRKLCRVAPGLGIGTFPHHTFFKKVLDYYNNLHFYISKGIYNDTTIVTHLTKLFKNCGYNGDYRVEKVCEIYLYSPEYFCPMDPNTGEIQIKQQTRSIHWYSASWKNSEEQEIHKKAGNIYKRFPNFFGKLLSESYKITKKFTYYMKKEGIKNVIRRAKRKFFS